jgi:hypothetical protein
VKYIPLFLLIFGLTDLVVAQSRPAELGSERESVQVSVFPTIQRYTDSDQTLTVASLPVEVFMSLGRTLALRLQTSSAVARGEETASLGGLGDILANISYSRSIGEGRLSLATGTNLPSGKHRLTLEEFDTSILLSRNFYNFRVPNLGQGFKVSSGMIVVYPVHENLVIGGGSSYLYKKGFKPLHGRDESYYPGNELLLTAGLDYRFNRTSSLSADLSYTRYGSDRWEKQLFKAGATTVVRLQFLQYMRFDELRITAHYRSRRKSEIPLQMDEHVLRQQLLSNQGELRGFYRLRLRQGMSIGSLVRMRFFGETVDHSRKYLADFGLLPQLDVSEKLTISSRIVGTVGSFMGIEFGLGTTVIL